MTPPHPPRERRSPDRHLLSILQAGAILLASAANAQQPALDHGELLLDKLSCTACHAPPPQAGDRFMARPGPLLGAQGIRFTPQWLREYLANPEALHAGGAMPDMLHALTPADKADAVENLTQYIVSRQTPANDVFEWDPALIAKGRDLYHTVGCVACHSPDQLPPRSAGDARAEAEMQTIQQSSEPFPDLPRMTSVPQLAAFLRDPVRFHPAGRMPSLKLGDAEATAIAAYLMREQTPSEPGNRSVPGVHYEYFEVRASNLPNFDRLKVAATGTVAQFDLTPRKRNENIALRYRGSIKVPVEGEYRFYTESDDGSKLLIDDKPVIENDGIHAMKEVPGSIVLKPGEHAITVLYFNAQAGYGLKVSWEGPGIAKQEIPSDALSHPGAIMAPVGGQPFTADPARAAKGRELYAQFNCAACHQGEDATAAKADPLVKLTLDRKDDCLSDAPGAGLPHYMLSPGERDAIRQTLRNPEALLQPLDARVLITRTMTLLDCYACHNRDQQGGAEGVRREYFSSNPPDLDLGDEGRIPPNLGGVGAKLQEAWLGRVLMDGVSVRPYMATRMPQFGGANVQFLPAAFLAVDGTGVSNPNMLAGPMDAKEGRKLAGVTGLGCIACHTFADHPSLGVPAIDLTVMTQGLQTGWFHKYLLDPQSLRPGTRMPSFWPAGKAVNHGILGGDTDRQIAALWTFLARGKSADLPDGLIQSKMELVADKQAVIYRNFIAGVGPRGIAVGYPEKADLAFDAGDMRIALIWQGPFIDAAKHRTARGMGTVQPLGHDVIAGPPGPPFALLSIPTDPWPAITGRDAGYQFRGYHLDDVLRPAFDYDFDGIHITDFPVAVPGASDAGLRRTISFETPTPPTTLYFRAALAAKIEPASDGGFVVDDQLTLKFSEPGATVRQAGDKLELLVPIHFTGNKATLEEDYIW